VKPWRPQWLGESRQHYEARLRKFVASARIRSDKTKAALNARHAKPGSLLAEAAGLPPGTEAPPNWLPALPAAVQRAAAQADQQFQAERERMTVLPVPRPRKKPVSWLTSAPVQSRRHRATGKPKRRRPNEDIGLGAAVHALAENRGISLTKAQREITWWLIETGKAQGGKLTFDSAMNRVRKARREYIRQCNGQGL
jgi:hypothetical protein